MYQSLCARYSQLIVRIDEEEEREFINSFMKDQILFLKKITFD